MDEVAHHVLVEVNLIAMVLVGVSLRGVPPMSLQLRAAIGRRTVAGCPAIHLSNSRGETILRLLGLKPRLAGAIPHKDLVKVIPACWVALNSPTRLKQHCQAPLELRGPQGATMLVGGIDVDYLQHRLRAVLELLTYARDRGYKVVWD